MHPSLEFVGTAPTRIRHQHLEFTRDLEGFKGGVRFPYGIKGVALQRRSKTTSSWHNLTGSTSLRALFTVDS